jgi:acyl transferase domain-containing protein/NAD(P)-dependent dehydrogenase (short-subunit alcohol dehydrogenase family)/acyl carrier protein
MDILRRQFVPAAISASDRLPAGALLLTDSDILAEWGTRHGLAIGRVEAQALEEVDRRREILDRIGPGPLLYGIGFGRDDRAASADAFENAACGMVALLADLIRRPGSLDILALRRPEALVAALFDGMLMTARQESARLRCATLIVEDEPGQGLVGAVAACLARDGTRHRFRRDRLECETVVALDAMQPRVERLRENGCYVVTGGAGGVGRLLSAWLAERYRANICVLGRSVLDDALRSRLKAAGVRAYAQVDVADADALVSAMETFSARFGRIDGVFHLAGTTRDRMIANKSAEDVRDVVRPKVAGALNLDRLRGPLRPGFVCAFTSLSGFVGNLGQSDYAAANACVDALVAHAARTDGNAAAAPEWLAVSWGLWESDGMRIDGARDDLRPMSPSTAMDALERILASDSALTAAFDGDRAVLGAMASESAAPPIPQEAVDASAAIETIVVWLRELVFRYTKLRDIDADASLIELGVDSAALISLVSAIEKRLSDAIPGLRLNKAMIFDHPSLSALARHLCEAYRDAVRMAFMPDAIAAATPSALASTGRASVEAAVAMPKSEAELATKTLGFLQELLRRFTGLVDTDVDADLLHLGVDSVASIHFSSEIERRLAAVEPVRIAKALIFDYPSLRSIAAYLLERHGPSLSIALSAGSAKPAQLPDANSMPMQAATTTGTGESRWAETAQTDPGQTDSEHSHVGSATARGFDLRDDDIAIVGMAGEFPGAEDLDALWAMLESGSDAITAVPADRWSWEHDYSPDPKRIGASYGRHGGFLRRAKQFDPVFFGITPVEAAKIDPQERRLLETAYRTLEDGGHFAMPDTETGVFVAAMFGHYQNLDAPSGPISASFSSIANRISFTFDFQGPSLCVDTMCSGSLTALHLAVASLRVGECRRALVGGVNVMPHPGKLRLLSEGRFLSPSGRCHSFGIEADGYVPGEGAIALLLKPLSRAIADGDRIHGVIRGTALNSGGRASGFTVPSRRAQERVIRKAIEQAGVDPAEVDYVEAHGTGTSLGDPIEISALDAAYGRHADGCRRVGSIKSNVGHLESAAGLAGLVKILLQFRHGAFVPTLNCTLVNPYLQLESTSFALARENAPWPSTDRPRIAGLSSFGAGGSNAHVILQEYVPTAGAARSAGMRRDRYVMPISSKNARALKALIERLAEWLERHPEADPYAVGCTLARHREHLRERACFVVAGTVDFGSQLRDWLRASDESMPSSQRTVLTAVEQEIVDAFLAGDVAQFEAIYPVRMQLSLPHYVFDDKAYWHDAIVANRGEARDDSAPSMDMPAVRLPSGVAANGHALVLLEPYWRPEPSLPADASFSAAPRCVVVCDLATAAHLRHRADVATVVYDDAFSIDTTDGTIAISIRPGQIEDAVSAIRHVADGQPAWMIVLSRAFSGSVFSGALPESLATAHFALAKAAIESGTVGRIAYAHATTDAPIAAAMPALYRVLGMEENAIAALALEVGSEAFDTPEALLRRILAEMSAEPRKNMQRRIDGDGRWSADVRSIELTEVSSSRFRPGGVYLITGGLGMIGQGVAVELMRRYAATVILVGRTQPGPAIERKLSKLRNGAGRVEYASVDIGDPVATAALTRDIVGRYGALHGVLHSAGMLRDGLLRSKTQRDFEDVLAAKVAGARNLDAATQSMDLDMFVLFSSLSGLFGNVGQADYAVGNAFLDAFAKERRREVSAGRRCGLTLSIDWPLWYDSDDADEDRMREYRSLGRYLLDNFGIAPLPVSQGCDLLLRLIDGASPDTPQIAPLVGDVERILASVEGRVLQTHVPANRPAVEAAEARPTDRVVASSGKALQNALADEIAGCVAGLSGLADDDIDRRASYGDLGLGSILLQELAAEIETRFGLAIPPSALFTYNAIDALASYLVSLGASPTVPIPMPDPVRESAIDPSVPAAVAATQRPGSPVDDRIAIIGIDGRLPGGRDLDGFWRSLVENRSAIGPVARWPDDPSFAGTIPDIDHFDAKFFGISAREAMLMDPQHRLFLQCSYNAVLDAGYSPRALSNVGVFAGVQFSDYQTLLHNAMQGSHPYAATGNAHAMLANRVSYLFDFEGPSQTIDTACSSALVAVNRAAMALRSGECEYAIAGAVSLLIDSAMTRAAESMGVLSPRYRCATFDAEADGYVRSEGVGCVLLKRYADALRDGDAIHAVIESIAENHGGRANSLTAPNPNAQRRLLMRAYSPALANRVSYIETHGTGTKLGDPVEVDALKSAWRELVPAASSGRVTIGSVKSNIGHLEPAAGIASLLKVVLAMRHELIPANLHFRQRNPYIVLEGSPFRIAETNRPWTEQDRVAGISSFGFGGTNAHIVVSEPPRNRSDATSGTPALIVLSARTAHSLMMMKSALAARLRGSLAGRVALHDVATTLALGREHFEYRLAWVADDLDALVEALEKADGGDIRRIARGSAVRGNFPIDSGDLDTWREAYLAGRDPDWSAIACCTQGRRIHLPGYAFDTRAYWFEATVDAVAEER